MSIVLLSCRAFRKGSEGDRDDGRAAILEELGRAIDTRPFDRKRVHDAAVAVRTEFGGEGPLMEAIGMAAAKEGSTKCADVVGKPPVPSVMLGVLGSMLSLANSVVSCFRSK